MQAKFISGDPIMIPYTPSGAIAAGDVIVEGDSTFIAHLPIAANTLGAVAAGGGVYEATATGGSGGDVIALGDRLYWDDTADVAEESATSNVQLGIAIEDKAETATTIRFVHIPLA